MLKHLLVILAISASALFGQTNSGTILGAVRDPQDAIITTANVTITNVATGVFKTVPVTQAGQYSVPYLVPGEYKVSAEASGFKRTSREGITLRVSDQPTVCSTDSPPGMPHSPPPSPMDSPASPPSSLPSTT